MTTDEVVRALFRYRFEHVVRAPWYWRMVNMTEAEVAAIIPGATTFEQGWVGMRNYFRRLDHVTAQPSAPAKPRKVKRMTTREFRNRMRSLRDVPRSPNGKLKCWEAVLNAFGIDDHRTGKAEYSPKYRKWLAEAGWELKKVEQLAPAGVTPTLAVFMGEHASSGDYLIDVSGHTLAMRDGVITDTAGKQQTVARRVEAAWEVYRKPQAPEPGKISYPHPRCRCPHPEVFGHLNPHCETGLGQWKQQPW